MLEAADHVARTDSAISRMETGQVAISHLVLEKLLDLYHAAPEEREALRILAGEARQRGWWHTYGDAMLPGFDVYLGLEAEATTQWVYEPEVIPGLFQTGDYMRAMLEAEPSAPTDEESNSRVALREARQQRLVTDGGPALWVVLHEAALHHRIGGVAVMGQQLRKLQALSSRSEVALQVLPFAAGAHPAMHVGGFTVLSISLGGDTTYDITYLEHRTGALYLDKASEVDEHKLVFDQLRATALDRRESQALITAVANKIACEQGNE
jgi:hypothetical protein